MYELGGSEIVRVYAKHDPYWDTDHPHEVIEEMRGMGAPTINVVEWRGDLFAVEGSHRLYAAYVLGVTPNLIVHQTERFDQSDEYFWDSVKLKLPHYAWLV